MHQHVNICHPDTHQRQTRVPKLQCRGRVDDSSFFYYSSPFCFLSSNFIVLFPYSVTINTILFLLILYFDKTVISRRDFSFVPALLFSIRTPFFLPSSAVSFSYFIRAVPMRECFGKTLVHEFPMSYSHTEWYHRVGTFCTQ